MDVQRLMFCYTLDSIAEIGFGSQFNSLTKPTRVGQCFDEAQVRSLVLHVAGAWWSLTDPAPWLVYATGVGVPPHVAAVLRHSHFGTAAVLRCEEDGRYGYLVPTVGRCRAE